MKLYVISCDARRYQEFLARTPEPWRSAVRVNVTPDTCGVIPPEYVQHPKTWALTTAFGRAVTDALNHEDDALVLEDDVVFRSDFRERYAAITAELPADWDMLYLGGQIVGHVAGTPRQSGSVMSGSLIHRLHAWQIRLKAIPRLLALISNPPFVNTLDHQILVLHREPDFHVYYPANGWLVGQAPGVSSLSGQYNPERWWEDSRAITGAPTCQFEWRAGKFTCPICGRALSSTTPNNPPIALCRPLPPIRKRVRHYIAAVAGHLATGCQTRTDEEVADRLAICHSCDRFNPKRQSCSLCGCRCTAGTAGFLNKLRMKTESCPRGKWN